MFPVFAVERAKTGVCFVAGDRVTLCQKGAEHEVQIQGEMCIFFFCFFAGAFYAPAGAEKWQRHPRGVPLLYIRPVPGSETPGEYLF